MAEEYSRLAVSAREEIICKIIHMNLRVVIEDELDYVTAAGTNNRPEVNE